MVNGDESMKIRIEIDTTLSEDEILIRCQTMDEKIVKIQQTLQDLVTSRQNFVFYKGATEYYLPLENILFFETTPEGICAHTHEDIYETKCKLYELEECLPGYFMRVSKSTILNVNYVYSITRNLTASSLVEFRDSHKHVYVSRNYYKALKSRLEEKRLKQ